MVVSVVMKLTGGSGSFARDMNPDAFLRQAREFEEARCAHSKASRLRPGPLVSSRCSRFLPLERAAVFSFCFLVSSREISSLALVTLRMILSVVAARRVGSGGRCSSAY